MQLVLQVLIDMDAIQAIGPPATSRTENRTTHRNGSRCRPRSTKAGTLELAIRNGVTHGRPRKLSGLRHRC